MNVWMRWRLRLAWHRHQLRHWRWQVLVAVDGNDPPAVGVALGHYDTETRIVHRLELGGP